MSASATRNAAREVAEAKIHSPRTGPQRRRFGAGRALVYAALIIGSVVCMIPFAWLVRSALMGPDQIFTSPPEWIPRPFVWSNFSEALTIQPFYRYFLNTMTIELFVVTGIVITCSLAGYSFARLRWPGRNLIFGILLSGLMLPYAVTLIPTFIFWQAVGGVNTYLPLTVPAWFAGAAGGAFNVFLLRQFFLTIPKELDEAAYIDGATPLGVFWRIILPLSKPALIVVTIFTFIAVWNDFLGPLIYLNDDDKFTLALGLASFRGLYNAQWGYLMAASTAVITPIIVLFFFAQRYFIEGITMTGIKG
jgi:multiple sugar transport system permease protein